MTKFRNIKIFLEVYSWSLVSFSSICKWRHKAVDCCFGSGYIGFLTEASHKFDLCPSIMALKGNFMLSEARKHLSKHSWQQIQHQAFGGVTTSRVWMVHRHDLTAHKNYLCNGSVSPCTRTEEYYIRTDIQTVYIQYQMSKTPSLVNPKLP